MKTAIADLLYRVLAPMIRVIIADEQRKFLRILNKCIYDASNGVYGTAVPFDQVWDIAISEYSEVQR